MKGNCIDCICMQMYLETWNIYVSETKYLKHQQNIEGNTSFRISKCKDFISSLAPLDRTFIDFSEC